MAELEIVPHAKARVVNVVAFNVILTTFFRKNGDPRTFPVMAFSVCLDPTSGRLSEADELLESLRKGDVPRADTDRELED